MNRRGVLDEDILSWEVAYLVLFVIFFIGMFYYVTSFQQGAAYWEDFYAKEFSRIVNTASPGDIILLDVTKATKIAHKTGKVDPQHSLFLVDNVNKRISVSLSPGSVSSYAYFSNVTIIEPRIEQVSGGTETNRLSFKIE